LTDKGAGHPLRIVGALLGDVGLLGGFVVSVMSSLSLYLS